MPQVTVKDQAFHDPRLRLASALLNVSRATLSWELISVWSLATDRNSPIVKPSLIGAALERGADQIIDVFVAADLAEPLDGDLDLSPMASLFGDCHWLQRKKDAAPVAGKVRAQDADQSGQRGPDGRFTAQPLRDRVIACLEQRPMRRKQLRQELRVRRGAVLSMVRTLINEEIAIETDDGLIALASTLDDVEEAETDVAELDAELDAELEPEFDTDSGEYLVPDTHVSVPEPDTEYPEPYRESDVFPAPEPPRLSASTGEPKPVPGTDSRELSASTGEPTPVPGTDSPHAEPSALAPARAPALALARASGARAREEPSKPDPLDTDELVSPARRRDVARRLWAYQNRLRTEIDPKAPKSPLNEVPGGSLDAVILALARYSPAQCKHALDIFAAEGRCIAGADGDGLQFLNGRTNWKREQLDRAVVTTAEAIEKRFRSRGGHEFRKSAEPARQLKRLN